jgi:prevent-host-death family protein
MAQVGATEFKARCLELMDRVRIRRETFVITKRGKPVAKLVPLERDGNKGLFGSLCDQATITGDITAPAVATDSWEILGEWDGLNQPDDPRIASPPRKKAQRRSRSR